MQENMNLPSIREAMQKHDIIPSKKLGQNFLFDLNITDRIVKLAGNVKDNVIIEIGPGPGALTRSILNAGAKSVIAIEKDPKCVAALQELKSIVGDRLTIIEADALKIDMKSITSEPVQIIANLPYNIATALLFKWLEEIELFSKFTLMFQREVAERIDAVPNNKTYGRVSVMTQFLCETEILFNISPESFIPPPKITSSVISITKRKQPLFPVKFDDLSKAVKLSFSSRRKNIRNNLKQAVDNPDEFLNNLNIDPKTRAENLSIEQFCLITEKLF